MNLALFMHSNRLDKEYRSDLGMPHFSTQRALGLVMLDVCH